MNKPMEQNQKNTSAEQNQKITPTQLVFLVIETQVGVAVLSLPHQVQETAKGGAWISVLVAGFLAQLVILLRWALSRRFPQDTFFGILTKLLGKWIGKVLVIFYIIYALMVVTEMSILFTEMLGRWVLFKTPRWVTLTLGLITGVYLARESLRAIARFYVVSSFMIIGFVGLTILTYTSDINFYYIFPITEAGWFNILIKGVHQSFVAMLGYEILAYTYPFVQGTSKAKLMAASVGNFLVTLLYTFVTFTSLVSFSPEVIARIPEPVLYKLKALSLQVIERIDLVFISIWVVVVITSGVTYLYIAAVGVKHLMNNKKKMRRKSVPYLAAVIYLMTMTIQKPEHVKILTDLLSYLGYFFTVIFPLFLFFLSFILKNKVTNSS